MKQLALSKLVHLFMTLPDPEKNFFKELEIIFFKFLWGRGGDKVKRTVMMNSLEDGGLRVPHVLSFCKALKFVWIQKLLNPNDLPAWKLLNLENFQIFGGNLFWVYDHNPNRLKYFNPFWQSVIKAWHSCPKNPPSTASDFLKQTIWYNPNIKIGGK